MIHLNYKNNLGKNVQKVINVQDAFRGHKGHIASNIAGRKAH